MRHALELPGLEYREALGRGGTAKVDLVYSKQHATLAALKYPHGDSEQRNIDFQRLAERENDLIAGDRFPGLVRILSLNTDPAYLLLEYCSGPTLESVGRIESIEQALNVIAAVATSLEYIRARHLIHGDLKPDNIFLPLEWEQLSARSLFYAKISDFSLGRRECETHDKRTGLGTIGYMAPEMIVTGEATCESDLFALGVIAYQVFTGIHPFMADNSDPVAINARIREDEPVPIASLRPEAPSDACQLVHSLLSKRPEDRPSSAWHVCQTLRRIGARYPFESALHPKYFIQMSNSPSSAIAEYFGGTDRQMDRFRYFCEQDWYTLRLMAGHNFKRQLLKYNASRYTFAADALIPSYLVRRSLAGFNRIPLSRKKAFVRAALSKNETRDLMDTGQPVLSPGPRRVLLSVLPHLLRVPTVKRLAASMASVAEKHEDYLAAARHYLLWGSVEASERCAFQAAALLRKENRNQEAIALLSSLIDYARDKNKTFEIRQQVMTRADIYKDTGNTAQAHADYQFLVDLYSDRQPDHLLAEAHKDLGDLFKMRQRFNEGLEALRHALEIYESLDDELEISHIYNNMGNLHWFAGNQKLTLTNYRKALRIQRKLGAREEIASTLNNMGAVLAAHGNFTRGIRLLEMSLMLKKEIANMGEIARTLNNLGYIYYMQGDKGTGVDRLHESLTINRKIGSKNEVLHNLENLTSIMITAGRLKESIDYLKEGMEISEALHDVPHLSHFNVSMSTVLMNMGRVSEAQHCLDVARAHADKIDDQILEIDLGVGRARLAHMVGQTPLAIETARDTLRRAVEYKNDNSELQALVILTMLVDDRKACERALKLSSELNLGRENLLVQFNRVEKLLKEKKTATVDTMIDELKQRMERLDEDLELPRFHTIVADHYVESGDPERASRHLELAYSLSSRSGALPYQIKTLLLLGRMAMVRRDYETAYGHYRNALDITKRIARSISRAEQLSAFQSQEPIRFLVGEIKELGKLAGQKKRAGV